MGCRCPECRRRFGLRPQAEERAEELLFEFLLPEQQKDWKETGAFNVRGSDGRLHRIDPEGGHYGGYVVSDYSDLTWNITNVWPVGLGIPADRALAMMLYLLNDATAVWNSGCHDSQHIAISDYAGSI
jgi:hypothetical protein